MKKVLLMMLAMVMAFAMIGCGGGGEAAGGAGDEALKEMTLEEIILASYEGLEMPGTGEMEIDASNADSMAWYFGEAAADVTFKRAVASEAMISSIAHSVIVLEVEEGTDVAALAQTIKDNAPTEKWLCTFPEQVEVAHRGNYIMFAMSYDAVGPTTNFMAL